MTPFMAIARETDSLAGTHAWACGRIRLGTRHKAWWTSTRNFDVFDIGLCWIAVVERTPGIHVSSEYRDVLGVDDELPGSSERLENVGSPMRMLSAADVIVVERC